jgi:flagellar biosynthesis protein
MAEKKENNKPKVDEEDLTRAASKMAVSLSYDADEPQAAPKVLASGKGEIAEEIIKIAEENQIPLYEDPILAELLGKLEIDTEVPPELYVLVAEVLAFVYKLDRMAGKREVVEQQIKKHVK